MVDSELMLRKLLPLVLLAAALLEVSLASSAKGKAKTKTNKAKAKAKAGAPAAAPDGAKNSSAKDFWELRPQIVAQLSDAPTAAPEPAGWDRSDYTWAARPGLLYRNVSGIGLVRSFGSEAEFQDAVKRLACSAAPLRAPEIAAALAPLYWPVELPAVRSLLSRGGACRPAAFRDAYAAYAARHNAAMASPKAASSTFLVYKICCGQLGNRIQVRAKSCAVLLRSSVCACRLRLVSSSRWPDL